MVPPTPRACLPKPRRRRRRSPACCSPHPRRPFRPVGRERLGPVAAAGRDALAGRRLRAGAVRVGRACPP
eukprot:2624667-Alexandrium_andersonii.AAC.1